MNSCKDLGEHQRLSPSLLPHAEARAVEHTRQRKPPIRRNLPSDALEGEADRLAITSRVCEKRVSIFWTYSTVLYCSSSGTAAVRYISNLLTVKFLPAAPILECVDAF